MTSPQLQRLTDLLTPTAEGMGYRLVRLRLQDIDGRHTLQILAEPLEDRLLNVEDCKELSYAFSAVLDVEDPIKSAYALEVSSPGLARPLTRLEDYSRFQGKEITLESYELIEDRKRFKAVIQAVQGENIQLLQDDRLYTVPFSDVKEAKLVPEMKLPQPKKPLNPKSKPSKK